MAYFDVSSLQADLDFALRCTACYSVEMLGQAEREDPPIWQAAHSWALASAPGFGDAYAYAVANGVVRPGKDPAVITDGQILAAVQAITNAS